MTYVNILDLPFEDVAIALGHTGGGELVRRLYGHRDHERALDFAEMCAALAGACVVGGELEFG